MPQGGCACGSVRYEYSGEPSLKALCHCLDCRKITGSTYSTNMLVDGSNFKITKGTPKTWTKKADSGRDITSFFCGDCGSTLYRAGPTFGSSYVLKAGTVDGDVVLEEARPVVELFVTQRPSWVNGVSGTQESTGMPS